MLKRAGPGGTEGARLRPSTRTFEKGPSGTGLDKGVEGGPRRGTRARPSGFEPEVSSDMSASAVPGHRRGGSGPEGAGGVQVENVTAEFVVDDGPSGGRITVFQVTWNRHDPLAVGLALVSRPEHPALPQGHWIAPRDALRTGLASPVGDGNVRIAPEPGGNGVRIDLTDGERRSQIIVDATPLRTFLDHTEQVVPSGQEHPELALDAVLDELLRT